MEDGKHKQNNSSREIGFALDPEYKVVECDEQYLEQMGLSSDFIGSDPRNMLTNETVEIGRKVELARQGEPQTCEVMVVSGNGELYEVEAVLTPETVDGKECVSINYQEMELVEEAKEVTETPDAAPDPMAFENIPDERVTEISQAVRVEGPDGTSTLAQIMLDLTRGHNDLEQYKRGSLAVYEALDSRLAEEEKRNPDSAECEIIREVKRTAFGLYLRVQRGDMELHGDRSGRYSGYYE
jgi:PAS domain-containing protein